MVDPRPAAHRAGQAHLAHQPPDAAARHAQVLAAHLPPDLARPVDLVVLGPDATDDRAQHRRRAAPGPSAASDPAARLCAGSTSTGRSATPRRSARPHNCSRWSSMNATITSLGGRAPPGRNTRTLSSESRSRASARRFSRSSSFSRWRSSVVRPGALAGIALRLPHPPPQRLGACSPASRRSTESPPTATDARRRARGPSGPRAHVPRGNTCSVVPWAPSSQGMSPPTNPVRFMRSGSSVAFRPLTVLRHCE